MSNRRLRWYHDNGRKKLNILTFQDQIENFDGSTSFLFANAAEIYQLKGKDSEIKSHPLCLGNIWEGFSVNKMKKNQYQMALVILPTFINI